MGGVVLSCWRGEEWQVGESGVVVECCSVSGGVVLVEQGQFDVEDSGLDGVES